MFFPRAVVMRLGGTLDLGCIGFYWLRVTFRLLAQDGFGNRSIALHFRCRFSLLLAVIFPAEENEQEQSKDDHHSRAKQQRLQVVLPLSAIAGLYIRARGGSDGPGRYRDRGDIHRSL